jgi:hypothetical protein
MSHRVNTIACALLVGALGVPAAQACDTPAATPSAAVVRAHSNPFTGLGHEGSGLHLVVKRSVNPFTGLGHEGSGLQASWEAARIRPWAQ